MTDMVARARGWIGTPYLHQAARRGVGCDCLGLVLGVMAETGVPVPADLPPYTPDWNEPQGRDALLAELARRLAPCGSDAVGAILVMRMRAGAVAKHLAIGTGTGTFIHAYSKHGVVESWLTPPWRRRIAAAFAWPGGDI